MNCACVDTKHSFLKSHVNLILAIKILFVIYTSVYILLLHIVSSKNHSKGFESLPPRWRSSCPYNLLYGVLTTMVGLSFLAAVSWYCFLSSKCLQWRHKMNVKLHFKCYKMVKIICSPLICVMRMTDLLNLSTVRAVCCRISCLKQISWQQKYNTISNYNQFDSLRRYCPVVIYTNLQSFRIAKNLQAEIW